MDGLVLHFDEAEGRGIVSAGEGIRYEFVREDWKSPEPPESGAGVDFVPAGDRATEIYIVRRPGTASAAATAPPRADAASYFRQRPAMILGTLMLVGCLLPFLSVPFFTMTLFSLPSTFSFFVNLAGALGANTEPGMGGVRAAAWSLYLLYTIPAAAGWLIFREVGSAATRRLSLVVGLIGLAAPFVTGIVSTLLVRASAPQPGVPHPAEAVLQMLSYIGIGWMVIILASIGLVALGSGWAPFAPAARRD